MTQAWPQHYKERRFGVLLSILLVLPAGPPLLMGFGLSAMWFDGLMSVMMVAAIVSLCFEPQQRIFALLLGIPSILFSLGGHLVADSVAAWPLFLGHLCEVLFLFGSASLIVKSLFSSPALSFDSILGALCGYLFLGLGWAVMYSMIESLLPGSFAVGPSLGLSGESVSPPSDVLTYYSFITLTTVGYGDVVPASTATRTCAWLEAITGQFYLAVIVAGLVSMLATRSSTPQK
jgi:hypothetical protein